MGDLDFRALWDRALTYEEFVKQSTEHCSLWTGVYRLARIPPWALERACEQGRTFRLLALAEDWCGDASNTIPYVAKLGAEGRCLEMRILRRDENPEVMDRYLSGTARAIPIVILLDDAWHEVGHWGSRPAELQAWARAGPGEAHRLARAERRPGVVERHELELHRVAERDQGVAPFQPAEQLARSREPALVIPPERAVAAHGDERHLTRLHVLLHGERWMPAHAFRPEPRGQHQPAYGPDVDTRLAGGAGVAVTAREQPLDRHSAVRVDLAVSGVEDDTDPRYPVAERDRGGVHPPGGDVGAEHARAGQRVEVRARHRPSHQQPDGTEHAALQRDPGCDARAAHPVEGPSSKRDAVGDVSRIVAEAVVAEVVLANGAERASKAPPVPPGGSPRVERHAVAALRARSDVQVQRCSAWLGPLHEAEWAVAAIVERTPQPVAGTVGEVGIEVGAPVALGRKRRGRAGEQRQRGASGSQRAARRDTPCPGASPRCRRAPRSARGRPTQRPTRRVCSRRRT